MCYASVPRQVFDMLRLSLINRDYRVHAPAPDRDHDHAPDRAPDRDPDRAPDRAPDPDHDRDPDPDHDRDPDHDPDPDRDRDRDFSYPILFIAWFIFLIVMVAHLLRLHQ